MCDECDIAEVLEGLEEDLAEINEDPELIKDCGEVIKFYKKDNPDEVAGLWSKIMLSEDTQPHQFIPLVQLMDDVLLNDEEGSEFKNSISTESFKIAQQLLPNIDAKVRRQIIRIFGIWKLLGLFATGAAATFIDKSLDEVDAESDDETSCDPGDPNADGKRAAPDDAPKPKKRKTEKEECRRILGCDAKKPLAVLELDALPDSEELTAALVRKTFRKLSLVVHPDKNRDKTISKEHLEKAFAMLQEARQGAEAIVEEMARTGKKKVTEVNNVAEEHRCKFPGCQHEGNPKCANLCCSLLIKHCQTLPGRKPCFFHPPPVKR